MSIFEPNRTAKATADTPAPGRIVTTLYDLIDSLNTEAAPGEEDLVIAAMQNIMNTKRLTFLGLHHTHRIKVA